MPADPLNAALAHLEAGRTDQARGALERILRRDPTDPHACAAMSLVLIRAGQGERAAYYAGLAARRLPDDHRAQHNFGNVLVSLGRFEEALAPLQRAADLAPAEPQTAVALANALSGLSRFASAQAVLRSALERTPDHPRLMNNLGHALHRVGRIEEGLPLVRRACELEPANLTLADGLAAMLAYAPGASAAEQAAAAANYGRILARTHRPLEGPGEPPLAARRAGEPLRVGLLSPDLRAHAVASFAEAIFDHLDRGRFFLAAYNLAPSEDVVSQRLRAKSDLWRHVAGTPDADLARLIRRDRIHVLVDLAGHTHGGRLGVVALRAAPVQASAIGFPGSAGAPGLDARLVDSITDPPGSETGSADPLVRLDPCCNCYTPPASPPPLPAPRPADAPITFVSFGSLLKFNGRTADLWARALAAVPGSRLRVRHTALREEDVRRDVAARIAARGVDPARLSIEPPVERGSDALAGYTDADIALDTTPYSGTTTVCEALFMGVPVVSLAGSTPAGRVAQSILTAAGMGDWCARDDAGFAAAAADLTADRRRLAAIRAGLRERLLASPVCDGRGYAARLGLALETLATQRLK